MKNSIFTRYLSMLLAACLLLGNVTPAIAFAEETEATGSTSVVTEATTEGVTETVTEAPAAVTTAAATTEAETTEAPVESTAEAATEESGTAATEATTEDVTEAATEENEANATVSYEVAVLAETEATEETMPELYVEDYATFLASLKTLEGYAADYAAVNTKEDPVLLVINYVRTGVERYTEGLWSTMCGEEKTEFVAYVAEQDAANGTEVAALRNLYMFTLPNGDTVEFEHMFGTMNMSYITTNVNTHDLGGWAGDLCDLMGYANGKASGDTIEALTQDVRQNYLGVDEHDAFGMLDIYGDLDAFYFIKQLKAYAAKGETVTLSQLMEERFTETMTDKDRAEFFLHKRFSGLLTKESVREACYNAYVNNVSLSVLEADYGLEDVDDLRMACCYAFADYLYDLAGDTLTGEVEETTAPTEESTPDETTEATEGGETEETDPTNPYYSVFSTTNSTLAPGVEQTIKYAFTADDKQIVYYVATADINRSDVSVHANYKNNVGSEWGMARLTDQMASAQERHTNPEDSDLYIENYNVIAGVNADFFNMSNGAPSGALVMEGVTYHGAGSENFFAILKDGTPVIGRNSEWSTYADQVQEAVGGSIFLVENGEIVASSGSSYYTGRASRTCVGITADGKVVLMVMDGRQEPFSAGGTMYEIAQVMLEAGCVTALNLDGGGSTTYAAKAEGSDSVSVISRPSDGFERSISSSLMIVSTAKISYEFDHALIETDYDYLTKGTSLELSAIGVSSSGYNADIPENAVWQVSDESIGTISNGVFTAIAEGEVEVQMAVDGVVVGSKTLRVVVPDSLRFESETLNAVYGIPIELPLQAFFNGNPVAFTVETDMTIAAEIESAGTFDGLTFTGNEASGIRTVMAGAVLNADSNVMGTIQIDLYREDEAIFDFDTATNGDRILAWNREVTNSTLEGTSFYHAVNPEETMEVSYVFALDMEAIEIPEELQDIVYMLPNGDNPNATAWDFLLQLAERVSVLTEVKVEAVFDSSLDVDISELTISNDYFRMESATLDEATNTVTVKARWIDQTQAIDPATANPICILSGIKAVPKDGSWDANGQIAVVNSGEVTYDIYLRANALYNFALKEENQEKFNLKPFVNEDVLDDTGEYEKGGSYSSTYTTFEDTFTLDKINRNGWYMVDEFPAYYINNEPVSGLHKVPGYEDPENQYIYYFNEDGTKDYGVSGPVVLEGDGIYFAVNGELRSGWNTASSAEGEIYYYFDPVTYKAVDGEQTIDGYDYIFEDCQLIRGEVVKDSNGTRYMWAGTWKTQSWVNIDGNISYCQWSGYFVTGRMKLYSPEGVYTYYVFDDDGVWMQDYTNFYEEDGKMYFIQNGIFLEYPGIVLYEGEYFYITSTNVLVKNCNYWTSKGNGYYPDGSYTFGERGELIPAGTKFTITWANEDGTVLKKETLKAGAAVKYSGTTPTKKADTQYTYTFAGWTPEFSVNHAGKVTAIAVKNEIYTAVYDKTLNKYKISFVDENGTVLQQSDVEYGTVPTYTGETPTKASSVQYSYTFAGWDKELSAVTGEATYKAVFTPVLNSYTVTFKNEDGSVLQEVKVEYGKTPAYTGVTPTKAADVQYSYTFAGWDKAFAVVNGDVTYTATYTEQLNSYTITFKNENGAILQQSAFEYGTMPVYSGETPVKASTAHATYTFAGWSPELTKVSGETVYTAVYTSTINGYNVTFQNADGTVLLETKVPHGEVPVYTGETPTKAPTVKYSYVFAGWDKELTAITGNMIYTAVFDSKVNEYNITFVDSDGTVLQESKVAYGSVPAYTGATPAKAPDAQYTYTFNSWDKALAVVTGDAVYTAVYKSTVNTYSVTWVDEDGTVLEKDASVAYGSMPMFNGAEPAKTGDVQYSYTFAGWSPEVTAVTGAVTYTATYTTVINEYTISWDTNGDGSVDETTMVPYGEMPVHEDGIKENQGSVGFVFAGWNPALTTVTGPATYSATFTEDAAQYTIIFQNEDGTVLQKSRISIGTMPVFNGTPTKEADAQYSYTFTNWDKELVPATEDTVYTAQYSKLLNSHVITFQTEDGTVLQRSKLLYGVVPNFKGTVPEKPDDQYNSYVFSGWTPEIVAVSGPATYTTVYEAIPHKNGIVAENGSLYYYVYGELTYAGLIEIDGAYYYVRSSGELVHGRTYWITKTNDLVAEGSYEFDDDGKMIVPETVEPGDALKNGIVAENGSLYYYVNGELNYAGLIQIDGAYYYVRTSGELAHSRTYWITKTNGLMAEKSYTFASDGKMVLGGSGEIDTSKNGIVAENGSLYYYVDGVLTYAGLIKLDGEYYYVRTSGELVVDRSYWITKTNGLMAEGSYTFDGSGKITNPVEADASKNGIVAENGSLYYYENGVLTYAGLIQIDGAYYYVKTGGEVVHGRAYWITKTNGLKEEKSYTFDESGKMVLSATGGSINGIVSEDGSLYYYVNGERTYAGLIQLDGAYYYVKTNGEVVTGRSYWVSKTNGLKPEGLYTFGADGKLK